MKQAVIGVALIMLMAVSPGLGAHRAMAMDEMFEDVPASHWAFASIQSAYERGIAPQIIDNRFEPEREVTRAEFVQMVAALLKLPASTDAAQSYTDVGEGSPYVEAVTAAKNAGLLTELTEGGSLLLPGSPITREEAASVLGAVPSYLGMLFTMQYINLNGIYEDFHQIDRRYNGSIQTVYRLGLMQGTTKITFAPKDILTRAQAATILIRLSAAAEQFLG